MKYTCKLKKYCKEYTKIENYEQAMKDNFKGWVVHHRLELTLDGEEVHTPKSLIRLGMYYDRPYYELIFMKRSEHVALHNHGKGSYSEERRLKIAETTRKNMANPEIKAIYDKNRWKFPIGNYFGKIR